MNSLKDLSNEELERIGYHLGRGIRRGLHELDARPAPTLPSRPKPPRTFGDDVQDAASRVPVTAAQDEWARMEGHASECMGCGQCRAWAAERQRRIRKLGQMALTARVNGIELDPEQAASECGIPQSDVDSILKGQRA